MSIPQFTSTLLMAHPSPLSTPELLTIFQGHSAWFAPELDSYVHSWVKCGGTVKPLVEADIAFVSDETSRNDLDNNGESGSSSSQRTKARTATTRLSMTILRPEWIVDSISGQRRASLGRYKRSFPPLRRCDSSSFQGDDDEERGEQGSGNQQHQLLSGMEAFRSKNFLSFSPSSSSSVPLYQPVSEFHDLSLISNSSNSNIYDTRHNAALNTNINTSSSNRFSPFGLSSTSSPLGPSQRTLPLLENQRASSHGRDSDADATDIDIRSQIRGFDQFIHDNTMGYDESAEGGFIPTTQNWDDPSPSSSSFLSMRRTTMSMMMERTTEPLSPVLHLTDSPFSPLPGPEPSRTAQQCQKRAPVFQQDGDAEEGETAVMVFVSDHLTPEMPIARKRRLPETVLRTKRPSPKMRDTMIDDDFFASTDSEHELDSLSNTKEPPHVDEQLLDCQEQGNRVSVRRGEEEVEKGRQKYTAPSLKSIDAETYLRQIWTNLDPEYQSVLSGDSANNSNKKNHNTVLELIDIPKTNISMHRR